MKTREKQETKKGFNKNRSCIEINRKEDQMLSITCLIRTEVVLK